MSLKGEEALILGMDYTEESLLGAGALKGQDGQDGVSPIISVNTSTADTYKLDITDKNGTITTPNLVGKQGERGEVGETGADGETPTITENADNTEEVYKLDFTTKNGTFTTKNIKGKQGLEGVSPTVTTNPDNTTEDYRLNITTKGGSFTTPNLKGPQGERGPIGESAVSAINPRGDYDVNAEPSYTKSDYITYTDGNTYVCKLDNPTNEPPIDGTVTDTYWQVIAFRGAQGIAGRDGEKGADGVTFTPSIDANGVLSFTNNGGLENPEPIDIKGDNGVTFTPSIDAEGYLSFTNNGNLENPEPIKVLGQDGADGKDGIDGTTYIPSIGTVTTVESNADASAGVTVDEETKEAVFHFEIPKGEDGFSPIVETVESENGHTVNIADVEGVKSFEVLNGKDGVQIDDETASTDTVWSSQKTSDELAKKLTKNYASLTDANIVMDSGNGFHIYRVGYGCLNTPVNRIGIIISNNYYDNAQYIRITQTYMTNDDDTANGLTYMRYGMSNNNGSTYTWSDWRQIGCLNDTKSSATSTYSSSKIDEKYGAYTFGTAGATQWLKLTLGNSSKFQPIVISDQYGGKVEITGMADDGTYKSVKLVRYSYGDWTTYSATDYTVHDGVDPNYKIQRFYYYPTDGYYYLEIRQWTTLKVEGNSTAELVTSLPAEKSEMTLIPESNWGSINDSSTSTTSTWSSNKIAQQDGVKQVFYASSTSYPSIFWVLSDATTGVFWFKHTLSDSSGVKSVEGYADLTHNVARLISGSGSDINVSIGTDTISGKKGVRLIVAWGDSSTTSCKITEARPVTAIPTEIVTR